MMRKRLPAKKKFLAPQETTFRTENTLLRKGRKLEPIARVKRSDKKESTRTRKREKIKNIKERGANWKKEFFSYI